MHELLFSVANDLVRLGLSPDEGRIIDVSEPLVDGSECEGFMFYQPVFFDPEFGIADDAELPIVLTWLSPVTRREMEFVEHSGIDTFENMLVAQNPDPFDPARPSILLPGG